MLKGKNPPPVPVRRTPTPRTDGACCDTCIYAVALKDTGGVEPDILECRVGPPRILAQHAHISNFRGAHGAEYRNEYYPDCVSAPGVTLREMLEERSMTRVDLAARTGQGKKTINDIINGKTAITPGIALQLEKVLGLSATFWLERERLYQEHTVRHREAERSMRGAGHDYCRANEATYHVQHIHPSKGFWPVVAKDAWCHCHRSSDPEPDASGQPDARELRSFEYLTAALIAAGREIIKDLNKPAFCDCEKLDEDH